MTSLPDEERPARHTPAVHRIFATDQAARITLNHNRGVCVYACSPIADECPWTCSGVALDVALTELVVDLMAVGS